jgi:hypothetical protein
VHRPSVRLGSEPDVTYSSNGIHGPKAKATIVASGKSVSSHMGRNNG